MIEGHYRQIYQTFCVEPFLPVCKKIRPENFTLLACLFGMMTFPMLALGYQWIPFILLLVSGFLDTLDGSLARYQNKSSAKGAVLDIVSDRIVEFSVVFGLYFFDPGLRGFASLLMLGSILLCVTTFLVVGIFTENNSSKGFYYSPGIMERAEAFIFFFLMILFPSYFIPLAIIFSSLTFFTAFFRLWQFVSKVA